MVGGLPLSSYIYFICLFVWSRARAGEIINWFRLILGLISFYAKFHYLVIRSRRKHCWVLLCLVHGGCITFIKLHLMVGVLALSSCIADRQSIVCLFVCSFWCQSWHEINWSEWIDYLTPFPAHQCKVSWGKWENNMPQFHQVPQYPPPRIIFTVYSGNSKRLNSEQSLISEHFWWNWAIFL